MRAEAVREPGEERQRLVGRQLIERQIFLLVGVLGDQLDALVRPCFDPRTRAKRDGGIERLRAGMKKIQWPDVDSASSQINSIRR